MKKFQVLFAMLFVFAAFVSFGGIQASAACVNGGTDVMDNDNNAIGSSDNVIVGPWEYQKSTNSFRGDHRYLASPSTSTIYEYDWRFSSCSGQYGHVYVYVWDTKFTNQQASYRMYNNQTIPGTQTLNVYLNQRTAPGGWNYLGKTTQAKTGVLALVVPTAASGGTGADAAKIDYSSY